MRVKQGRQRLHQQKHSSMVPRQDRQSRFSGGDQVKQESRLPDKSAELRQIHSHDRVSFSVECVARHQHSHCEGQAATKNRV